MKTKAVYAGSFDPLTNGHSWIIDSASELFDEVVVSVAQNPSKKYTFTLDERIGFISKTHPSVKTEVVTHEYLVKFAKSIGATHLVRGLRSSTDFEYEKTICNVNRNLESSVQTVFLIPPKKLEDISSSFVKGMVGPVGWNHVVDKFVSKYVFEYFQDKYLYQRLPSYANILEKIISVYRDSKRTYHNINHLIDMFGFLDLVNIKIDGLEKAILYHDYYDERFVENAIEKSSELVPHISKNFILVTKHGVNKPLSDGERLMVDLDLAILGSDWYDEYSKGIYDEYVTHFKYKPEEYKKGRTEILMNFLKSDIYHTKYFKDRFELTARKNIEREIKTLCE